MAEIFRDENGIWTDNEHRAIDYPTIGNSLSFSLEENSFWFKHRNNVLLEVMKRFTFQNNFADIGGGNGFQAKFIANHFNSAEVFLIEPGYQGCLNARKRGLENVYNMMFSKFDFKSNNVTAIGLFDIIEHIEKDCDFLIELKNKLPKGSIIYITVPAYNFLWSEMDDIALHYRRYDLKMIKELSTCAGIELLYTSCFFSYLPFLTFFFRSLPYRLKRTKGLNELTKEEKEEHNPSSSLLKIFDFFHNLELNKIKHSKVPFGASYIAVLKT